MAGTGRISLNYAAVGNVNSTHQYNVTATFEIGFNYGGYNSAAKPWSMSCDGQTKSGSSSFSVPNGGGSWKYTTITTQTFTITMDKSGAAKTVNVSAYMETGINPSSISASNSITLPAVTWNYNVTYNGNGGTWNNTNSWSESATYGQEYTTQSNFFSRAGYSFVGWNEKSDGTGTDWTKYIGKPWTWTYTKNITLYAVWQLNTYTITYNANGGDNAPSQQTKTHGQTLTLSAQIPTRPNYNFVGWSTNPSASGAEYQPGGAYYDNNNATLYAVWDLAYWSPKITNVYVNRCDSDGANNEEGRYAKVSFKWECCQIIGANDIKSATVGGYSASVSGTSGTTYIVIGNNSYEPDNVYNISIIVVDSKNGTSTYNTYVDSTHFAIDFKAGGTGVAIGMPAKQDNLFAVAFPAEFYKTIKCDGGFMSEDGNVSGRSVFADSSFVLKNRDILEQKVLWSGAWYGGWAKDAGSAVFSESVQSQPSGIVLIFQEYDQNTQKVSGTDINSFFISKKQIALLNGAGVNFTFAQWYGAQYVSKYMYILDTKITGNVSNADAKWTSNGITFCNNWTVLTKVIGV